VTASRGRSSASAGVTRLFATCPVGGCSNLVSDPRQVCSECRAAFASYLRPSSTPVLSAEAFAAKLAEADARHRQALAARHDKTPAWKANQRCWVCEERRTCREEQVGIERRWVCKTCEQIR